MSLIIDIIKINEEIDYELDVKELSLNDFLLADKLVFTREKIDLIEKRLNDSNYKAYGIVEDGILKYSTWISYEKLGLPVNSKHYLNNDEALLEDSYCHPNERGKGIHSKMNIYRIAKIYEANKKKVIAIVYNNNQPALKVQLKSGFEIKGVFYAGKILGFSFNTLNKIKK